MAKVGRRTKLTKKVQEKVCEGLRAGLYNEQAAILAGIGEKTFYEWLSRGDKGEKPFQQFTQAVKDASATAERNAIEFISKDKSWQSKAWFLERRNYKRWGVKQRIEQTGEDGEPIKFKVEWPDEEANDN